VLLSGAGAQTVSFGSPSLSSGSAFNILEWTGSSSRLVFSSAYFVRVQSTQMISFPAISNKLSNATPFTITATGGGSGLPVTFTTSTSAVCTVATASGITTVTLAGIAGTCTITANQAGGLGYTAAPPVSQSFTVTLYVPLVLQSVKSRKTHGTAGFFDVTIDLAKALDADISVDPRNSGGAHQLIFTFNLPITSVGGVTATGTGGSTLGSVNHIPSGNVVTVNLSDIPDARRVKVALTGLNGGALAEAAANVGFLMGDVTGNGSVTAADIMGIKTRFVTTVTNANFRADINLSGSVNAQDVSQAKSRAGMRLQ
jgi:hypothetical protein